MFEIYNNKKVLITGHTGFKGSWLSIWLLKNKASIVGCSLDPKSEKDNFILSNLSEKIDDCRCDIRDYQNVKDLFFNKNPEIIFHFAAQPLVLDSYDNPLLTIESNTQGTLNVLEAFRKTDSAKYLIIATTDKVYQNDNGNKPFKETDVLGGSDPYSASKAAAELLVKSYYESFFKNTDKKIVTVRAGNVIGGGDWSDNRIVPDCIKSIENKSEILIRNPNSFRPWQHVLDPIAGYLLLGERMLSGDIERGAWNFGPTQNAQFSVKDLVELIVKSYGAGSYKILNDNNKAKESQFLSLDVSKVENKLNWSSVLSFNEIVDFTVDWYKNYTCQNIYELCLDQINKYQDLWKLRS